VRWVTFVIAWLFLVVVAIFVGYSLLNARLDGPQALEDLGPVYCLAISRDGQRIVSGHHDSRARVWNVDSGDLIAEFGCERPAVVCATFSPDGNQIAFAHADEFVRIWDLGLGRETKTFRGHTGTVRTIAYLPNGKQILSAGGDKTIRLWDVASATEERCFVGHDADVNAVASFADGRKIISASGDYWGGRINDSSVRVWDVATGKEQKRFVGEFGPMKNVILSSDNHTALTCSWDTRIQFWNVDSGTEIRRFGDTYTNCIALSPNGRQVVSGGYRGEIKLWSAATGELLSQGPAHSSAIHGMSFCPDGIHVIACSGHWGSRGNTRKTDFFGEPISEAVDCTIRLWAITANKEVRRFNAPITR